MDTDTDTDTVAAPGRDLAPIEKLREELALIEEKVVLGFTFADAIREGASVGGQLVGGWVKGNRTCAQGAAWVSAKARGYLT